MRRCFLHDRAHCVRRRYKYVQLFVMFQLQFYEADRVGALWEGVSLKQEMLVRGSCTWQMNHRTALGGKRVTSVCPTCSLLWKIGVLVWYLYMLVDFMYTLKKAICLKSTVILALGFANVNGRKSLFVKSPMYFSFRPSMRRSQTFYKKPKLKISRKN